MATFTYSARTQSGDLQAGELSLKNRDEVVGYLRRNRLIPVKIEEKQSQFSLAALMQMGAGVKMREIVIFARQFATMINSGLPLVQSLDILAKQSENQQLKKVVEQVLYDVESGHTLADAMRQHPRIFSDLFVNMVAAGEAGGILDTILLRLAVFLEKADALRRKIKGAMIYPGVVMSVAVIAVAVLLIFVIPTFQNMFEQAGVALPGPTQFVIFLSEWLQARWYVVVGAAIAGGFGIQRYYKTPQGQLAIDRLLLRIPILGPLQRKAAIARFTRTLGTLVSSGVAILDGLEITARTAGNRVVHDAIMESR
ncbi:MAG: type II secretion system F family protein, partial [Longimicrobiales bacterium]